MTIDSKSDPYSSMSELESLGLGTRNLNQLNDSYEMENLVENIKQMLFPGEQMHACIHRLTLDN